MILLLGFILRGFGLESRSLQYDDTFSIFLSARSLPEILSGTAADTMPPLYYFLLHYWMLLGQSAWFIRLLSVILSLAAVFLFYRLVAAWFGRAAAGWAAFLAAVSPLLIYHGQDVRMYALLVVCQLGYLWFFTRIWQGNTNRIVPQHNLVGAKHAGQDHFDWQRTKYACFALPGTNHSDNLSGILVMGKGEARVFRYFCMDRVLTCVLRPYQNVRRTFKERIFVTSWPLKFADYAGLVICGAGAMYSHNVAIFGLVVPDLFLLIRREWKLLARLIAAQAMVGLLALPWLMLIPGQIAKVQQAWTLPRPGLVEVLQAVIMFTASLPLPVPLLALAMLFSLQIVVMLGLELWRDRGRQPGAGFWLILLLLPPGLMLVASFIMKPIFIPRAFLVSSLAFEALAGLVIARTWSRGVGKLLAGAFVLAALISLPSQYTYNTFPRSPYRQADAYLEKVALPGDRIIHETKLSYFSAHFYAPGLPQVFLADPPGSPNDTFTPGSQQAMGIFPQPDLATAVGDSRSVYFITFTQTLQEYKEMGLAESPNIRWLEDRFRPDGRVLFSDLEIDHYVR